MTLISHLGSSESTYRIFIFIMDPNLAEKYLDVCLEERNFINRVNNYILLVSHEGFCHTEVVNWLIK